jgi:hypothetical protein
LTLIPTGSRADNGSAERHVDVIPKRDLGRRLSSINQADVTPQTAGSRRVYRCGEPFLVAIRAPCSLDFAGHQKVTEGPRISEACVTIID